MTPTGHISRFWEYNDLYHLEIQDDQKRWHCVGEKGPSSFVLETEEPYSRATSALFLGGKVLSGYQEADTLSLSVGSGETITLIQGIKHFERMPDVRDTYEWLQWIYGKFWLNQ